MVDEPLSNGHWEKRIILRPNGSLDRRGALFLIVGISSIFVTLACYLALIGCWVVAPFLAAALIATIYCLLHSLRESSALEVITIDNDRLRVEFGQQGPKSYYEFQKYWAKIRLVKSRFRGHPSRLAIRSHGREIEIGRFLVESERRDLAVRLTGLLN